jgi:hypothetical protein
LLDAFAGDACARATVALVEQREVVKFFWLSERLRLSHGRLKLGPWQYGLHSGKYIGAPGTRLDERLAYPGDGKTVNRCS